MEATRQLVSRFSCSTSWVPGIKLRLSGLSAVSTHWATSPTTTVWVFKSPTRWSRPTQGFSTHFPPIKPSKKKKQPTFIFFCQSCWPFEILIPQICLISVYTGCTSLCTLYFKKQGLCHEHSRTNCCSLDGCLWECVLWDGFSGLALLTL